MHNNNDYKCTDKFQKYAMGKMEWNKYGIVWNLGTICAS